MVFASHTRRPRADIADGNREHIADVDGIAINRADGLQGLVGIKKGHGDVPTIGARTTNRAAFDVDRVESPPAVQRAQDLSVAEKIGARVIQRTFLGSQTYIAQLKIDPIQKLTERPSQVVRIWRRSGVDRRLKHGLDEAFSRPIRQAPQVWIND